MPYDRGDLVFLPIRPNDDFARRLAQNFYVKDPDDLVKNLSFSNGEYCPTITDVIERRKGPKRLSGRRACIVYSYTKSELSITEAFARILFLSDAASKSGAREIYLVMAEHLFDRQDLDPDLKYDDDYERLSEGKKRKVEKLQGQPFSLEVAVRHFHNAGIARVLTLDAHSEAIKRVYEREYKCSSDQVLFNLDSIPIFVNYLLRSGIEITDKGSNLVLVAPDKGAKEALLRFYKLLGLVNASRVQCDKYRRAPNDPSQLEAVVDSTSENFTRTKDKIVIALDDKGDTFGTLQKTLVQGLAEKGKPKQIHVMLSHLIMSSRGAYETIEDNKLNVHGSNSHPNITFKKDEPGVGQITVLDFTPYFAWALAEHLVIGEPLSLVTEPEELVRYLDFYKVAKKGKIVDFS